VRGLVVVDASVVVAALAETGQRGAAAARVWAGRDLVAPDVIGYEVLNTLRGLRLAKKLSKPEAERAVADWRLLAVETWSLATIADRVWALAENLTAYDAAYVALAERLRVPLLTADKRLANAPGIKAEVVVV